MDGVRSDEPRKEAGSKLDAPPLVVISRSEQDQRSGEHGRRETSSHAHEQLNGRLVHGAKNIVPDPLILSRTSRRRMTSVGNPTVSLLSRPTPSFHLMRQISWR